ncbi:MAG: cytochrome b [Sphingobacteriia bacterium]|nr:cytochrome b [Sphingobacteriia bacterium]NCC39728.1 cytochrome b [Gammaproteobacteria bacterium]
MAKTRVITKYNILAQAFHWVVAILLFGLLGTNLLRELSEQGSGMREIWLNIHMSLGILLFGIVILRLVWTKITRQPEPLPGMRITQLFAKLVHVLLNLATLLVPIGGYLRIASKDLPADFFGTAIPSIIGDVPWIHDMAKIGHGEYMELFFYVLIGLHVLAALWHQYIKRDGALDRILPWGKPPTVA